MFDDDAPVTVERVSTPRGEWVLRRRGEAYEVISNGTFLMDTRDGRSERLLVSAALAACAAPAPRVLIGGLGVGFSADEAIAGPAVSSVTVVEIEPALVAWHASHLRPFSERALTDPRTTVVVADLVPWLAAEKAAYDVICLDIDNGPQWTVVDDNRALYSSTGLARLRDRLAIGGVLSIWSAAHDPSFESRLHDHFTAVTIHKVDVPRGEPDIVYIASGPPR